MKWSPDPFYYKRPLLVINPPALLAPAIEIKSSDVHGGCLTTYNYDSSAGLRVNFDIFLPGDPAPNFPAMYWVHGDVSQDLLTGAFAVARREGFALICIPGGKFSSVENWSMSVFVCKELPVLLGQQFPHLDTTRAAISGRGTLSMFVSQEGFSVNA